MIIYEATATETVTAPAEGDYHVVTIASATLPILQTGDRIEIEGQIVRDDIGDVALIGTVGFGIGGNFVAIRNTDTYLSNLFEDIELGAGFKWTGLVGIINDEGLIAIIMDFPGRDVMLDQGSVWRGDTGLFNDRTVRDADGVVVDASRIEGTVAGSSAQVILEADCASDLIVTATVRVRR